ncbi:unnamed protein product [Nezara viridula]|uniref:Uncharacterized protein n=1 Tax=Nezara viridula TaxID=85310 RepID=A0A9P0HS78_NEZVI|nr:unnamed protein product [Nezara viridula]
MNLGNDIRLIWLKNCFNNFKSCFYLSSEANYLQYRKFEIKCGKGLVVAVTFSTSSRSGFI